MRTDPDCRVVFFVCWTTDFDILYVGIFTFTFSPATTCSLDHAMAWSCSFKPETHSVVHTRSLPFKCKRSWALGSLVNCAPSQSGDAIARAC